MKKLLLLFVGFVGFSTAALAQPQGGICTPDPLYTDSVYGAWPDTVTNFPPATANVYYETVLNFKAPAAVTADLDPTGQFVGSPIQSYTVTSVDGAPTEYLYACNISNCSYTGGVQGCATVYGTTATLGTYPIVINLDVVVLVTLFPGLPPTPVTQSTSFTGYKIVVSNNGAFLDENGNSVLSAFPNPARNEFVVNGLQSLINASDITLSNVEGKVLAKRNIGQNQENFDMSALKAGIYFVNVAHANGVESIRIIKE
ncbi:MAG: T9SS type A sorting domain-containing protein [Crocinitomicaceae bacterium]